MSKSHHFRGIDQYSQQLMDLAEGKQVFTGRGHKPSNRQVLDEIASVKACNVKRRVDFFAPSSSTSTRPCTCGWHVKAAERRKNQLESSKITHSNIYDKI